MARYCLNIHYTQGTETADRLLDSVTSKDPSGPMSL